MRLNEVAAFYKGNIFMKRFGTLFTAALLSTTAFTYPGATLAGEARQPEPMEEIVVRGANIPEPKRETSEISSFLSVEDLAKQGDGNAAMALRRVTGLTLVGNRFIYVRGLGERYSSALLNGMPLPSPEPLRRVVPLDLFPSAILESAAAQKTYSPQYSAEFGGGLVEIRTKGVPERRILEAEVSFGGNTETTWRNGLMYDGGSYDWLGFDSGVRSLPDPLRDAIKSNKRVNSLNFTNTELQTIGRSLENSKLWVLFDGTTPGNIGLDFTYGDRLPFSALDAGFMMSVGYDNSWTTKRGVQQEGQLGVGGQLDVGDDFNFVSTQNDVRWHGLLGLGANTDTAEYKFTSLYIRSTTKEGRILQGQSRQFDAVTREDSLEWFERQMWTNQIDGLHTIDDKLTINWKGSYSIASRDAPYERAVQYRDFGDGVLRYDQQRAQNLTRFSTVDDTILSGGLDVAYKADFTGRDFTIKAGYSYTDTDRESEQRDYRLLALGGPIPPELLSSRIDYIFADQNINPGRYVLTEITGSSSPPAYLGALKVHGAYAGFDAEVVDYVRAALGVRYETGDQIVDTYDYYTPNLGIDARIKRDYWLPAGTVTWNFAEDMQARIGASQTIGRPQFREIAPTDFIDPDTDRRFIGNPFLINPRINNIDARWEWYFDDQQYVTLGGFYKTIKNPIEETVVAGGDRLRTTFQNVPRAKIYGLEAEAKYIFTTDFDMAWFNTKDFFVSTNYTLSESKIDIKPGDTIIRASGLEVPAEFVVADGRPLQGHSKHIFNIQLGYEDVEARSAATLLLNYSSKRIRAVSSGGVGSLPDVYEQPPLSLDFNYNRSFDLWGGEYEVGLNVENILGSSYSATQRLGASRVDVDTYDVGQSFSVSFKRRF
jgi:outer membrane receptor protein involved in Fe transport